MSGFPFKDNDSKSSNLDTLVRGKKRPASSPEDRKVSPNVSPSGPGSSQKTQIKLICLNNGLPTFFHDGYNTPSWLDISLVSDDMVSKCEWEVLNDLNSDHLPILTHYNVDIVWKGDSTNKPKWNLHKANWPLFTSLCKDIKLNDFKSNNIDKYNDDLVNRIMFIANKAIPIAAMNNRKKSVPWWSNELGNLIKKRNKARSTMQKNKSPDNIKKFKDIKYLVSYSILKAKKDSWANFCSSIKIGAPSSKAWSNIKRVQGKNYSKQVLNNSKIYNTNKKKG